MTVTEMLGQLTRRLDDASTSGLPASANVYWSSAEMYAALNEAQQQFAILTLSVEDSGTVALTGGTCFYSIRDSLSGYLRPLRVSVGGVRLQPARLSDLDARYFTWPSTAGSAAKYFQLGLSLLGIVPQPASNGTASVLYAREPVVLSGGSDVPEIPAEYHLSLVKYATYYLLQKRGGQYLALAIDAWRDFLADASQCADYVRRRNRARQYDSVPAEFRLPVRKEGARIDGRADDRVE
jgi:hypothetical protein